MTGDEQHFNENHKKLLSEVYDKSIEEVYKMQKQLVKKFKIEGIYFKNNIYKKKGIYK